MAAFDQIDDDLASLALATLDAPVALSNGVGEHLVSKGANPRFEQIARSITSDLTQLLRDAETGLRAGRCPFPGHPDWVLTCKPLGDTANRIWQAERRPAEATHELVAEWVSTASMGDMGVFFFDPDGRLRAYNSGVGHYFPPKPGFPVPGAEFDKQLSAILDVYAFEQIGDQRDAWRSELTAVYTKPGYPALGVTPTGRWALATATRMGDGSTMLFMNDVTEFRDRDQQLKLFMRNAEGILFSRRELKPGAKLQVWGDTKALKLQKPTPGFSTEHPNGWYQLIDQRDRAGYIEFMEAVKPGDKPYTVEFRYAVPGSKRVRWIRELGWTIQDSAGRNYLDALYFDITETKDAHQALSQSEDRFRQFAELASDWYFETDEDLRMTFVSERYESISERSNEDLLDRPYDEIVAMMAENLPENLAKPWRSFLAMWQQRRSFGDQQLRFRSKSGTIKTISISGEPRFTADGRFIGYRGIGRDMTALADAQDKMFQSLDRAQKANETKSSFIANVSHELRTPLNAILGFSSIMAEEIMGPMQNDRYHRYAADIFQSGNHLLSLVNDLLDLSRLEAGRYAIEDEDINLAQEMSRVFDLLSSQSAARTMQNNCPDEGCHVRADRRAVRQVLINIVANAVKFTEDDGRIAATIQRCQDGGLELQIFDNGVGIGVEDIDQIFQPFGRVKSDIAAEGTGLGLPLSRNLMQMHDGDLAVQSTAGEGTRVTLRFPPDRVLIQATAA